MLCLIAATASRRAADVTAFASNMFNQKVSEKFHESVVAAPFQTIAIMIGVLYFVFRIALGYN